MYRAGLLAACAAAAALAAYVVFKRMWRGVVQVVIVFSGKRKSGKDYLAEQLLESLPRGAAEIGRLSGPLKEAFAAERGLDYARLLSASAYKEEYRAEMILWGEVRRVSDAGYFARRVLAAAQTPILVVSDARRLGDVAFFAGERVRVVRVRVEADDAVRRGRGWTFVAGVDDVSSECGLDGRNDWDVVLHNVPGRQVECSQQIADLAALAIVAVGGQAS
ncbi:Phosphomevalonate kinase-domain-containing protein [Pelagophyceae sp. CCMP2097]|nr:Phosphomevalonate kinase-domain-containing protein [Pelagophyceae sp. CCMP2097]